MSRCSCVVAYFGTLLKTVQLKMDGITAADILKYSGQAAAKAQGKLSQSTVLWYSVAETLMAQCAYQFMTNRERGTNQVHGTNHVHGFFMVQTQCHLSVQPILHLRYIPRRQNLWTKL
jgi:predicted TPR repeat methyltransferase